MKNKSILITAFIIVCIALGIFALQRWNTSTDAVTLKPDLYKEKIDLPSERAWLDESLIKLSLLTEIHDSLLNAMIIKQYNDTLYIVDYADMKIKRFTTTGHFIDKFGKNIGRGPSDFLQILDFSVYGNTLIAVDKNYIAKKFHLSSKTSYKSVRLKDLSLRIVSYKDQFTTLGFTQDLFKTYDVNDSIKVSFGELSDKQFANIFGFGGYLIRSKVKNTFIYAPRFASYLIFYNMDGTYIKSIQTIDRMEFQKQIRNEYGIRVPNPSTRTQSITYNKKYNYIHYQRDGFENTENEFFHNDHSIIDVYNRETNNYVKSISVPQLISGITVIEDTLYTINNYTRKIEAFILPEME